MNTLTTTPWAPRSAKRKAPQEPLERFTRLEALPACWQWKTEGDAAGPKSWVLIHHEVNAATALHWARQNVGMVWLCDFQNAKQLLVALQKRLEPRKPQHGVKPTEFDSPEASSQAFHVQRLHRSEHLKILSKLLIPIQSDYTIGLHRAPLVHDVLAAVWGQPLKAEVKPTSSPVLTAPTVDAPAAAPMLEDTPLTLVSLKELLGYIGAHEWHKKGLPIPALSTAVSSSQNARKPPEEAPRIYPHYGVFSPVRGEYLNLVKTAPLPRALENHSVAQDVGVGTGVLSAILLSRGVKLIIATDTQSRAIECAQDNFSRLGLSERVQVLQTSLFADELTPLVVCNPPWLPGKARSPMERAIFDPESSMLKGFLNGLRSHLSPQGEGWLIMSDLAERLGLRAPGELLGWIESAGLEVVGQLKAQAVHPKSTDTSDAFYQARQGETTSLWRLQARSTSSSHESSPTQAT